MHWEANAVQAIGHIMRQNKRLLTQFGFFILQNPFLKNFINGQIHQGGSKVICSPGLNCYSCPAAAVSCPIGAAQLFLAGARHNVSLYVTGFLLAGGALFGRFICGYVCPMGLLQDLLYRIKTPKRIMRFRLLRYLKYIILVVFIVILPLAVTNELSGLGQPWFCKYICPSGTIFGAIPLLAVNGFLRRFAGTQLALKVAFAAGIIISAVFIFRIFCRILCPLGAIYALFNKISILHMRCDREKCVSCGKCSKACHITIEPAKKPDSPECVRCGKCVNACDKKALRYTVRREK